MSFPPVKSQQNNNSVLPSPPAVAASSGPPGNGAFSPSSQQPQYRDATSSTWMDRSPKYAKYTIAAVGGFSTTLNVVLFALAIVNAFSTNGSLSIFICATFNPIIHILLFSGSLSLLIVYFFDLPNFIGIFVLAALTAAYHCLLHSIELITTAFAVCAFQRHIYGAHSTTVSSGFKVLTIGDGQIVQHVEEQLTAVGYAGIGWNLFSLLMYHGLAYLVMVAAKSLKSQELEEALRNNDNLNNAPSPSSGMPSSA